LPEFLLGQGGKCAALAVLKHSAVALSREDLLAAGSWDQTVSSETLPKVLAPAK
jgi:hypothetical protein